MKISEIFFSIQGEGPTIGEPAVFLRLQGCNLRCKFCDTKYTWNFREGKECTILQIASQIRKTWGCVDYYKKRRLVITGGEPLLQKEAIDKLIERLDVYEHKWKIEIETNGTIMPTKKQLERCQFNCSPKLKNSENPDLVRINESVLRALYQKGVNSNFKFVVANEKDVYEVMRVFLEKIKLPKTRIILMPLGISSKMLRENARKIVDIAKRRGFRIIGRFHVNLCSY